jgi:hypothetical protein
MHESGGYGQVSARACGRVTYSKVRGDDFSELRLRWDSLRLRRGVRGRYSLLH